MFSQASVGVCSQSVGMEGWRWGIWGGDRYIHYITQASVGVCSQSVGMEGWRWGIWGGIGIYTTLAPPPEWRSLPRSVHILLEFFLNVFTEFREIIFVITTKGLEPATSCVRDQDTTTAPARHMSDTGSLN